MPATPLLDEPQATPPMHESHLRSVLKGLTWRVVATTTIIVLAWWKTGDVTFALELGAIEFVLKFLLYYLHERAWASLPTGTIRAARDRVLGRRA